MPREKTAALHLVATWFEESLFVHARRHVALIIFLRDFDSYIFTIFFHYGENERFRE